MKNLSLEQIMYNYNETGLNYDSKTYFESYFANRKDVSYLFLDIKKQRVSDFYDLLKCIWLLQLKLVLLEKLYISSLLVYSKNLKEHLDRLKHFQLTVLF